MSHALLGHQIAEVTAESSGEWVLVFRQSAGFYKWKENDWTKNANKPEEDNYAILDKLEDFRGTDGMFEFKLQWKDGSDRLLAKDGPQIWKQSNNPTTSTSVADYEEVQDNCKGYNNWYGLALSDKRDWSIIDGSRGKSFWYCIMCKSEYGGGIPACRSVAKKVELYVWKENHGDKAMKRRTIPADIEKEVAGCCAGEERFTLDISKEKFQSPQTCAEQILAEDMTMQYGAFEFDGPALMCYAKATSSCVKSAVQGEKCAQRTGYTLRKRGYPIVNGVSRTEVSPTGGTRLTVHGKNLWGGVHKPGLASDLAPPVIICVHDNVCDIDFFESDMENIVCTTRPQDGKRPPVEGKD
jgi:hypothetical protein